MPEEFITKMARYVAYCHRMADAWYYSGKDDSEQSMVDLFMTRCDTAGDICAMFGCIPDVWREAKKIYDFTNSGREGYTLRDGKIVEV